MKNWMKFLETLAGKLTAILAFAVLIIVVIAQFGHRIPDEYRTLVYVVAIGAMIIFTVQIFVRYRAKSPETQTSISKPASSLNLYHPSQKSCRLFPPTRGQNI